MSQGRNWCFTHNNYTNTEWIDEMTHGHPVYRIYGKEVGASGTPHLQGFVAFRLNVRLAFLKKHFPQEIHWEIARLVPQAIEYCKKDGDVTEHGECPRRWVIRGSTRWEEARSAAENGDFDSIPADMMIRYRSNLIGIHNDSIAKTQYEDTEEQNEWYWGSTGTGKSRKAREDNPGFFLKLHNKWWDHYEGQETVIIDDLGEGKAKALTDHIKQWADRYPFPAEKKGSATVIRPKKIIVTSNYSPDQIWADTADLEPILRRFKVVHFDQLQQRKTPKN